MLSTDISKELKSKIETNQSQLLEAIKKHQKLISRLKESDIRFIKQLQDLIEDAQQQIVIIGLEQKSLVERLRKEHKAFQRTLRGNITKNCIEERCSRLTNSLTRARKQNIIARNNSAQPAPPPPPTLPTSPVEEPDIPLSPPTPEPVTPNPINPQDITQAEFLGYFGLVSHEVCKEIQTKRAERKRRRTANPQFLYTRGWDISKRKRNMYLASNVSPPNTRQSTKNKRVNSPSFKSSRPSSPIEKKASFSQSWPSVSSSESLKSEDQVCSECNKGDNLLTCENCKCSFHLACHNRPLSQTPKHCPKCYKAVLAHEAAVNEKLVQRSQLVEKNKTLTIALTKLQDKHSDVEDALRRQDDVKNELIAEQNAVEKKLENLRSFILVMQKFSGSDDSEGPKQDNQLDPIKTEGDALAIQIVLDDLVTQVSEQSAES